MSIRPNFLYAPEQILSVLGSILILFAYFLTVIKPEKKNLYFSISFFGGGALLVVAVIYQNVGLIVLEIAWMAINAWGLWRALRYAG
ncbi:MAG: hypothetical protein Q9M27_06755 [Mariprofundaceae bacterium]|nr:hypothetical protein [Mariprofundaceae bacterium]